MQHPERLTLARCGSFSVPAAISASPAPAASRFMPLSRAPCAPKSTWACRKTQRNRAPLSGQDQRTQQSPNHPFDRRWREHGVIEPRAARRHRFPHRYTPSDIQLLAKTDGAHQGLSAPAIRRILQREFKVHRQADYDAQTNKRLKFLTSNFTLPALTSAQIYKSRWQVELFFKWIKQRLRIKLIVLRYRRERRQDADLDRCLDLRAHHCRHRPETPRAGSESLPDLTDFQCYLIRKDAHFARTPSHPAPKTPPPMTPTN